MMLLSKRRVVADAYPVLSVPRLTIWDAKAGVAKDGSNNVTSLADQSGNGNHLTSPGATSGPTWTSANGGGLVFNGAKALNSASLAAWVQSLKGSITGVIAARNATWNDKWAYLATTADGSSPAQFGLLLASPSGGAVRLFRTGSSDHHADIVFGGGADFHTYAFRVNVPTTTVDSTIDTTGTAFAISGDGGLNQGTWDFTLGGQRGVGDGSLTVGGMMIYAGASTDTEFEQLISFAGNRWGS